MACKRNASLVSFVHAGRRTAKLPETRRVSTPAIGAGTNPE